MLVPDGRGGRGAPRNSALCGGTKVAPGGRAAGAVRRQPGMPRERSPPGPEAGGPFALGTGALYIGEKRGGVEEGFAGEVPFSYPKFSPLLLRSNCVSRGCSGADAELAGKWSGLLRGQIS